MTSPVLPAIRVAEEILRISLDVDEAQITEALDKLSIAEGTWRLLWGLDDIDRSALDREFYELKARVLRFIRDIKKDAAYPLCAVLTVNVERAIED